MLNIHAKCPIKTIINKLILLHIIDFECTFLSNAFIHLLIFNKLILLHHLAFHSIFIWSKRNENPPKALCKLVYKCNNIMETLPHTKI
jgi:hypothetical protein